MRTPLTAQILEILHQFLLLGILRNHRLPGLRSRRDLIVDVVELCIPVRMVRALAGLRIPLERNALPLKKPAHQGMGHRKADNSVRTLSLPFSFKELGVWGRTAFCFARPNFCAVAAMVLI